MTSFRRLLTVVVVGLMLAVVPISNLIAHAWGGDDNIVICEDTSSKKQIKTDIIFVTMDSNGNYGMRINQGKPETVADDGKIVFYDGDVSGTSNIIIRVEGEQDYIWKNLSVKEFKIEDKQIIQTRTCNGVDYKLVLSIVGSRYMRVEMQVINNSGADKNIGVKIYWDTMVGSNDAAPIRIEKDGWYVFEGEMDSGAQCIYRNSGYVVTPDSIFAGTWGNTGSWDADYLPNRFYTEGEVINTGDSAAAFWWNPTAVANGANRMVAVAIGVGDLNAMPEVDPPTDPVVGTEYEGQVPVSVTASDENGSEIGLFYSIEGVSEHSNKLITSTIANGLDQLLQGNIGIDSNMPLGVNTLHVWVEDRDGGKSLVHDMDIKVDRPPKVISVTSPCANGVYTKDTVIPIEVEFETPVSVTGTPQLVMNTGEALDYVSGAGTTALVYNYLVKAGDNVPELNYIDENALKLNGGSITDQKGRDVFLSLPAPAENESLGGDDIVVDTDPPTAHITGNPVAWTNSVNLTIVASDGADGSGIKEIRTQDGSWNKGTTEAYSVPQNGTYAFVVEDEAGNTCTVDAEVTWLDTAPPQVISENTDYAWKNSSFDVGLTYTDEGGSGVAVQQYQLTQTATTPTVWQDYNSSISIANDGNYYVHYRAIDGAGNEVTGQFGIYKLDATEPEIICVPDGDVASKKAHLPLVSVTDADGSGVVGSTMLYQWVAGIGAPTDGNWESFTNGTIASPANVTGTYYLWLKAEDNAGNSSQFSSQSFLLDNTAPTVTTEVENCEWQNNSITVTLSVSENEGGSGLKDVFYQKTNSAAEPLDWIDYTTPILIEDDGEYYVHYKAHDNANNEIIGYFGPYKIDKSGPTIVVEPNSNPNPQKFSSPKVTVEDGCGVDAITLMYQWVAEGSAAADDTWASFANNTTVDSPASANGNFNLYVKASDLLGNPTSLSFGPYLLDNTPPQVEDVIMSSGNTVTTLAKVGDKITVAIATDENIQPPVVTIASNPAVVVRGADSKHWTATYTMQADDAEGMLEVSVDFCDLAGNAGVRATAPTSGEVLFDKTPPTVSILGVPENWSNAEKVQEELAASDDSSGVALLEYKLEGAQTQDWAPYTVAIDIAAEGETTLSVRAIDRAGNPTSVLSKTIRLDRIAPTLQLVGDSEVTIQAHSDYTDQGVVASDNLDTEIQTRVTCDSALNTARVGDYLVSYNVFDHAGNPADTVTRTVHVVDEGKPVITLEGGANITLEVYTSFRDPGAIATDNYDNSDILTQNIVVTGVVDRTKLGTYTIAYDVSDSSGNAADTVTRTVEVVDTTSPSIDLNGERHITLEVGGIYEELGATARDNYDDDVTDRIRISGEPDTNKVGTYSVVYRVNDRQGNNASKQRTVEVVDTTAPELVLNGETLITLDINNTYEELGATATDNYDGDITSKIKTYGAVDTTKAGTYTVEYTVEDANGNMSRAQRTVTVVLPATGVSLDRTHITLISDSSEVLHATVLPVEAKDKQVFWSSSNTNVATVNDNGLVTYVGEGAAIITVTTRDGGFTATCEVEAKKPEQHIPVASISLNCNVLNLTQGDSFGLMASIKPDNASNHRVTWSVDNATVATVDSSGRVTAVGAGRAVITAVAQDGSMQAACVVQAAARVTDLTVLPQQVTIEPKETKQLQIELLPAEADQQVRWSSSNPEVVKVDSQGVITGVSTGTASIRVETVGQNLTAFVDVTVLQDVTGITLEPTVLELAVGEQVGIGYTVLPEDAYNQQVVWNSSNKKVATVDSFGNVVALRQGKTEITATTAEGSYQAVCDVTVTGLSTEPIISILELDAEGGVLATGEDKYLVESSSATLEFSVTHRVPVTIMVNGQKATSGKATINLAYGTNTIEITASDVFGNVANKTLRIERQDLIAPEITSVNVTGINGLQHIGVDHYIVESREVIAGNVEVRVRDSNPVQVTIDGAMASNISNNNFTGRVRLASGTNIVNIVATDEQGNSCERNLQIECRVPLLPAVTARVTAQRDQPVIVATEDHALSALIRPNIRGEGETDEFDFTVSEMSLDETNISEDHSVVGSIYTVSATHPLSQAKFEQFSDPIELTFNRSQFGDDAVLYSYDETTQSWARVEAGVNGVAEVTGNDESVIVTTSKTATFAFMQEETETRQLVENIPPTTEGELAIEGFAMANGVVQVYVDNVLVGEVPVNEDGTYTLNTNLEKGEYQVQVIARDQAGNVLDFSNMMGVSCNKHKRQVRTIIDSEDYAVDRSNRQFDTQTAFRADENTTVMALRLFQELGAQLGYERQDGVGVITLQYDDTVVVLHEGSNLMQITDNTGEHLIELRAEVINTGGRTYIPTRDVSEYLGFAVTWSGTDDGITIETK